MTHPQTPAELKCLINQNYNDADSKRADENRHLTGAELMARVKKQIELEKEEREEALLNAPYWVKKLSWGKLLETKLFNNPYG